MRKLLSIIFIVFSMICLVACESTEPKVESMNLEGTLWVYTDFNTYNSYENYIEFMDNRKVKIWGAGYEPIVKSYTCHDNKIEFHDCYFYDSNKYDSYKYCVIEEGEFSSISLTIKYRCGRYSDEYAEEASMVYLKK